MNKNQPIGFHNKSQRLMTSPFLWIITFLFLYALLAFSKIKDLYSFPVEGMSTTNELWLIPLLCFFLLLNVKASLYELLNKYNLYFLVCVFMLLFIILIGGFYLKSVEQYTFAVLSFIIPMLLFIPMTRCTKAQVDFLIKLFVFICLIYAVAAILISTNFTFFMSLLGNDASKYQNYSQVRAPMMLGSSIAVSYYFNLTLPFCFYIYFTSNEKKWKIISAFAILTIIIATFLLLSRVASLCAVFIVLYFLLFTKSGKKKVGNKIWSILLIIAAVIYAGLNFDLSRITEGITFSGDNSTSLRIASANLGLYIFTKFPIFGSGMGRFYERIYENSYIVVDEVGGLIDPHNMYVLILSELGIGGLLVTFLLFFYLFKRFTHIKDDLLRKTAYITLLVFLIGAMGGSHLLINVSFATVFWIYMGLFNGVSINDSRNNLRSDTR